MDLVQRKMRALAFWALGIAMGILIGGISFLGVETNAQYITRLYITWLALFLSALVMGIAQSDRVWRWIVDNGLGYLVVVVSYIFIRERFFFFPFSIFILAIVGASFAVLGAGVGTFIGNEFRRTKGSTE